MSVGIDAKIETLKTRFNANLFTTMTYTAYGRAFVNEKGEDKQPEVQTASSTEYVEKLLNDNVAGHSFFIVENEPEYLGGSNFKANVGIYFAVNLDTLYPSVTERAVESLHADVLKQINYSPFNLVGITMGLEAFSEFGFVKAMDNLEPYYLVRFNTEIEYNQTCNN